MPLEQQEDQAARAERAVQELAVQVDDLLPSVHRAERVVPVEQVAPADQVRPEDRTHPEDQGLVDVPASAGAGLAEAEGVEIISISTPCWKNCRPFRFQS